MVNAPHRRLFGAAVLLLAAVLAWPAGAQTRGAAPKDPETVEMIRKSNAECLTCHTEDALKNPPRHGMDLAKLRESLTDPALYEGSVHGGMACKTCHVGGYRDYPHAAPAQPTNQQPAPSLVESLVQSLVPTPPQTTAEAKPWAKPETLDCGECHAQKTFRIDAQVAKSVHAKNLKDRFTCGTCHDPHVYKTAATLVEPRKIVAQDNGMCLDCHNSDVRFATFGGTLTPKKARPDIDTIHAWLPNTRRHWEAVRCVECHTPPSTTRTLALSHEILNKDKAEKNCVTCHTQNTALRTRLYRYAAETQAQEVGFINSAVLGTSYVIGATRNTYLDTLGLGLIGLTIAGIAGHAAIRILGALYRRGRKQ